MTNNNGYFTSLLLSFRSRAEVVVVDDGGNMTKY